MIFYTNQYGLDSRRSCMGGGDGVLVGLYIHCFRDGKNNLMCVVSDEVVWAADRSLTAAQRHSRVYDGRIILRHYDPVKQRGNTAEWLLWTVGVHLRVLLCSLAAECQTLSPALPSTSPCPLWQLLPYLPIQHVMRKLTDRFLSSQ